MVALAVVSIGGTAVVTAQRIASDVLDNGLKRKPTARALGILVDVVSDVDRDGFGILGRFRDPDPFDSRVYPFAADIPGDGIDQDGVGGDLPAGISPIASRRRRASHGDHARGRPHRAGEFSRGCRGAVSTGSL